MAHHAHNFFPPGLFALGFFQDDDTRHEVYSRPTRNGTDTLLDVVWPGEDAEVLVTGDPDTERYVHARAFTACNVRDTEQLWAKLQRVAFDAAGELILPAPNAPIGLSLAVGAGGKIAASWGYSRVNQAVGVATFNVYVAEDGGAIDYDNPTVEGVAFVGYRMSTELTFADGTDTEWVIRSVSAAGVEESVGISAAATADAQAPAAIDSLLTEASA